MRGEFYQQLNNDLETARGKGCLKKSALSRLPSRQISLLPMEATSLTFVRTTISGLANHPDLIAAAKREWILTVSAWPRYALFAALRTAIKSLNKTGGFPGWKMRFSTLPALMLTVVCLKRCWVRRRHYLRRTEPRVYY